MRLLQLLAFVYPVAPKMCRSVHRPSVGTKRTRNERPTPLGGKLGKPTQRLRTSVTTSPLSPLLCIHPRSLCERLVLQGVQLGQKL